jgi:hypothetical protein
LKQGVLEAGGTPVATVTAGLAKMNDRSMSSFANEFLEDRAANQLVDGTVEEVAKNSLTFMRRYYDIHYAKSSIPEDYREGPLYLVGGYNATDHLPALFRVNVQRNEVRSHWPPDQAWRVSDVGRARIALLEGGSEMIRKRERAGGVVEVPERERGHSRHRLANRSGQIPDPHPETRVQPAKRLAIRVVRGRLEVVEIE